MPLANVLRPKHSMQAPRNQHALNQCSSPEARMHAPCNQHALKGQKLLAQGIALGMRSVSNAPCKVGCSKFESKIRYKKWCYFGAAKLLIFNTLIYEIVL